MKRTSHRGKGSYVRLSVRIGNINVLQPSLELKVILI